jgi:hypothetical protein
MSLSGANVLITGGLGYASSRAPEARRESQAFRRPGHERRPYGTPFLLVITDSAHLAWWRP